MQVEVNEYNIIRYGLVQLTGNSTATLLMHAAEAAEHGYVLTCEVPDAEQTIDMNVFEAAISEPVEEVEPRPNPIFGSKDGRDETN